MIVIDASVAAKLFRDEPGSSDASLLLSKFAGNMHAPDVFTIEVAGVIVRDANTGHESKSLQQQKLLLLAELLDGQTINLAKSETIAVVRASYLAMTLGHPLKDCLYLVLARDLDCPLVTADERFAAKARKFADVRLLGDPIGDTSPLK